MKLDIIKADKILFVADGARWIWKRVPGLMKELGISTDRFYQLLDFYHAVEHLAKVAELRKGWKPFHIKKRGLFFAWGITISSRGRT